MKKLIVFLFMAAGLSAWSQIAINTDGSSPEPSAMLDVKSTAKGFLPPRMTTAQRNAIVAPSEGLLVFNTDEKALNMFNGTVWSSLMPAPAFECGLPLTVNHLVSRGVAPILKTVTYGTVNGIPGEPTKCWITSNLGADRQATSGNDATEPSAGWYWQFNRKQGYKHDGTTRTPNTTWINSINESSDWIAANDPCAVELGTGWRIPTSTEWVNVNAGGSWINLNGPWNSGLKLHTAGYLYISNGLLYDRGYMGLYWSSKQLNNSNLGECLNFASSYSFTDAAIKPYGLTLRCLRE